MKRSVILISYFLITGLACGCGPKPWLDDFAEEPTDQVVYDVPIPKDFVYLSTRGFVEEDPERSNRYVEAYYRGEKSPAVVAIELEREMVNLKWKVTEKSNSGDKHTLRFTKSRPGGDNRLELCEVQVWKIEDLAFVMFKISPIWKEP